MHRQNSVLHWRHSRSRSHLQGDHRRVHGRLRAQFVGGNESTETPAEIHQKVVCLPFAGQVRTERQVWRNDLAVQSTHHGNSNTWKRRFVD